jgi:peptide/nickel transport system ATP-binding protein
MSGEVLAVRDLSVSFAGERGTVHALRHIDMTIPRGEIVGVVGESGSGKSTLALAIMGLLPVNATTMRGAVDLHGVDLLNLKDEEMRAVRGRRIAMVFQDPMTSLNPVRSVGAQMTDIQFREETSLAAKRAKALGALKRVGIPDAESQLARFPFQFSGGMRQRIAIAMGLLQEPELLIADEVTTALDVTLEAQILHLLRQSRAEIGGSILFISHNLGAVAEICDRVVVLYAGEIVETGSVAGIFGSPRHPYTQALISCDPARIETVTRELPVIAGDVPDLREAPSACIFAPRCPRAFDRCRNERPPDVAVSPAHHARCHLLSETVS